MKKYAAILLILTLLLVLPGCGEASASVEKGTETAVSVAPSGTREEPSPAATSTPTAAALSQDKCLLLYRAFLEENYADLSSACYSGFGGVGFIDLDLDGLPELVLFDGGASASMGVQFFDIADGEVTCVSASMVAVGELYGGTYFSTTYVNAKSFEDFRLLEDPDGTRYFEALSGNGAADFWYTERIRFTSTDGILGLHSVLYKRVTVDVETGEDLSATYTVDGFAADQDTYDAAEEAAAAAQDTGYQAAGAFIWEDKSYSQDYEGFLQMLDAAVAAYVPAV